MSRRNRDDHLEIDIEHLLSWLGVENVEKRGREFWFTCPFPGHNTSSNSNASFRESDRHPWWMFNCFVCGATGDAADFYARLQGLGKLGRGVAKNWLREQYGAAFHAADEEMALRKLQMIREKAERKRKGTSTKLVPIDECHQEERAIDWEAAWKAYQKNEDIGPLAYMFERGFMWQTLDEFEIGYDPVTGMISIPYRDAEHRLIGFKARATDPDEKPRYRMLGNKEGRESRFDFDAPEVSLILYGMWDLPPGDRLIVCEGELNRLALRQYGHRRVLGLSGQFLSARQVQVIKANCDEAVLIFDDLEKAERAAFGDEERDVPGLEPTIKTYIVPERDSDPADASDEEVAAWLDAAYPALVGP